MSAIALRHWVAAVQQHNVWGPGNDVLCGALPGKLLMAALINAVTLMLSGGGAAPLQGCRDCIPWIGWQRELVAKAPRPFATGLVVR